MGDKLHFLGFVLQGVPYNQRWYRKSRGIEKRKRIIARIKTLKEVTATKFRKFLRTKITKLIAKKLCRTNKTEEKNNFTKEFSQFLIQLISKDESKFNNFRDLLKILEKKLVETILSDTNEKIKSILIHFVDKPIVKKEHSYSYASNHTSIISKTKLYQASLTRYFTESLKREGFQHYTSKRICFPDTIRQFIKKKKIKLTYFPPNYKFPESLKKNLYVVSVNQKKKALVHNYQILILHL